MRTGWMVALVLGAFGCSHSGPAVSDGRATDEFATAYVAIKDGARSSATAGKYAFRGVGEGAVQVTDETKAALERGGERVEDAWVKTKVESKLARDEQIRLSHLRVDVEGGVVRLDGTVTDPLVAERAIRLALETKGVTAVDARLKQLAPKKESY